VSADEHPDQLRYTREHEWLGSSDAGRVKVGITAYAQGALGDIVYVTLPAVGTLVTAGEPLGEVESTKSVSDIYAPVSGTVVARNEALDDRPELINSDPYGDGWMVEIETTDGNGALTGNQTLDAAAYRSYVNDL
jgi:glycine cleavage system H protein